MTGGLGWLRHRSPTLGGVVGILLVCAVAGALAPFAGHESRATPALLLIVPTLAAAVLGGRAAAVVTAVAGDLAFSVGFIPPVGSLQVALPADVVALAVFLVVALVTGTLTAREGERRRAAEERAVELARMHARLEQLAAERALMVEEQARLSVLERIDQERSALLRSVSHDLRTPLSAIRAIATDLRSGVDYPRATHDKLLDVVADQAGRLDRLVTNLLAMSRIEAGAVRLERDAVDLAELLSGVVATSAALWPDTPVVVEAPDRLPTMSADYTQLEQVVVNLVENAVRHGPAGRPVVVGAGACDDGVWFSVVDEGPGVPDTARELIFEAFSTGGTSRSSGLGLAICKGIVEAHGGSITVGPAPGGRFRVQLPVGGGTGEP